MTIENKNEFSFDELTEPSTKPEEGEKDVFSFGEVPEPAAPPAQAGTGDFSFDDLGDPFGKPEQGETDVFSFGEVPEPAAPPAQTAPDGFSFNELAEPFKPAEGEKDAFAFGEVPEPNSTPAQTAADDFSFGEAPEPVTRADQAITDDFSFGEPLEPVETSAQDDTELLRLNAPESRELLAFTCRKCAAQNDVGFSDIQDGRLTTKCSSCKTAIEIVRDSCAKRASQTSRELYCVACGNQLGHHTLCPSCGLLFPDYFVAINPEEARRQARMKRAASFRQTWADLCTSLRSISLARPSKEKHEAYVLAGHGRTTEKPALSKKLRTALVSLAVVVAVAAGGFVYYRQYQAEQEYIKDYVKALYCIKMGTETSLSACARISEEWKTTAESRVNFIPRANAADDAKADKLKGQVDKLMQKLQKAPSKYAQANAKLAELNAIYGNVYALRSSPRGTLDNFNSTADKAGKTFAKTTQELKGSLSEKLSQELEAGKLRYRGLANI